MADLNVKDIVRQIKDGTLADMSALVPYFHVGNRAMSLEDRAPFKPLFTLQKPRYTTVMCGRQVSKSFSMCMSSILMGGMVDNMSLALIEPRYEQKKRMNAQVLSPLLKGFELYSQIMDPKGAESLEIKTFRNANTLLLASMFLSPDGLRGSSGLAACFYDECLQRECKLLVYDFELGKLKNKKVSEISYGDSLISFKDGAIVYSMAVRDASYRGKRSCYRVTTKSGRTITCTEGHLLPTNIGKKRLGEIVDYVYDQNFPNTDYIQAVHFSKNSPIIRARTLDSVQKREEHLKQILTQIDNQSFSYVSLAVLAQTPYIMDITGFYEKEATYFYDPIISIEYVGEDDVYDVEVVGTHNYILSNGICSYNCADLNPEFIPIVDSTMAAHETFGFSIFLGSAKTEDDALGDNFMNSSQAHWCIPCSCGHFNIAAPDQDLLKMIGKEGLICSKCGKPLYTKTGYYVHAYPSRRTYHAGYHVPQIVLPFHCERPHKWADILYEQQRWGKTEFYNEVLGIPVDSSTRLLSLKELLAARNYCNNTLEQTREVARQYDIIVVGVDWSGGGGGKSRTAIAVMGRRYGHIDTDCIYLKALRQGSTLDEEAAEVAKVVDAVQADYIAHDYTGAGFQREYILYSQYPYLRDLNYPVSLAHKPVSQLISYSNNGSRSTYVADRTRALLLLFSAVKSRNFTVPMFDPKDDMAPQLELLNEIEKPQTLESNSNVYLLQKVASKYDDCCFACAIGNLCLCDVTKAYPTFTMDTRYEMSPQQIEAVYGPDNGFLS